MTKLTPKQQTVLEYLQRYIAEHRRSPFLREIQEACRITSYKSVIDRLNALERKGFIKRIPNKHRAIHLHRKACARLQAELAASSAPAVSQPQTAQSVPSEIIAGLSGQQGGQVRLCES